MTKVIIHQPKNFESRYYRYYNYLFDGLSKKISENFDCLEARYFKHANEIRYPVRLMHDLLTKERETTLLLECEMLIENYDTQEVVVLSVSDDLTHAILHNYPKVKKILVSQFEKNKISSNLYNGQDFSRFSPWVYFPQNIYNYDTFYNKRKTISNFIDKFYFRGTSLEIRTILNGFNPQYFEGGLPIGGFEAYANDIINYKAAFSIAGRGEFCYRDIENMAMGIPIIRFEYSHEMSPALIPNFHYISTPRPSISSEHQLSTEHSHLIEKRFLEVKDDKDFLNFISKNARDYYENYIKLDKCVEHTYNLTGIEQWKK